MIGIEKCLQMADLTGQGGGIGGRFWCLQQGEADQVHRIDQCCGIDAPHQLTGNVTDGTAHPVVFCR
jgi:hypothetical protein